MLEPGSYQVDNWREGYEHRQFCGLLVVGKNGIALDACDRLKYLKRLTAEQLEQEVSPWKLTKID